MNTSRFLLLFFTLLSVGCSKEFDVPATTSTNGYDSKGTRHIPKVGSPEGVTNILHEKLTLARFEYTTSPISFPGGSGYVVGTRSGKVITFTGSDSLKSIDTLHTTSPVQELLIDSSHIVAIQTNGHITLLNENSKVVWSVYDSTPVRCNSLYTGSTIIVGTDSQLIIHSLNKQRSTIRIPYTLSAHSLAYDNRSKLIYLALTTNSSTGADSILCITEEGKVVSRTGLVNMRISTNLCLIGEKGQLAFGYFGDLNPQSSVRRTYVALYGGIAEGKAALIAKHELPYIPMNIAANDEIIVSSGFRERSEELASGIDAFAAATFEKRWQRRFSEPLVAPVSISDVNIYFTLSFTTTAETPSNGLLYVLSAEDGKTDRELAIKGVRSGFAAGMPMPLGEFALMLSDNQQPIIYIIRD